VITKAEAKVLTIERVDAQMMEKFNSRWVVVVAI